MIKSMTAFARSSAQGKWGTATWEIRSVNHRYLDCIIRLPDTLRQLEPELREIAQQQLSRGRIECFLKYQPGETVAQLSINTNIVQQLAAAATKVSKQFDGQISSINPMQVLAWHNVLQTTETDSKLINQKIINLFSKTLEKLIAARQKEGAALSKLLSKRLQLLITEVNKLKPLLPKIMQQKRTKILAQLDELVITPDTSRLEQELVFWAQKTDVEEELDRLETHINATTEVLKQGGVIGKRLDFLMQELNREANTLAAKSVDKKTSHAAIELKILIEQMREQIQNIE